MFYEMRFSAVSARRTYSYRYNVTYRYAVCDFQVTFDANNGALVLYAIVQLLTMREIKDTQVDVRRM